MVEYDSKNWVKVLFSLHKTHVLQTLLPSVFLLGLYTGLFIFGYRYISHEIVKGTTVIHSLLGFVLGLMLVFRTNTAYDKWWEGRKLWGSLVNNSRNFALKLNSMLPNESMEEKSFFVKSVSNFAFALKEHLREGVKKEELQNIEGVDYFTNKKHIPNHIVSTIYNRLNELYSKKIISGEQLITLDKNLDVFTDVTGACERIKKTPIPYSYNIHLKQYIALYVVTLPWGLMYDLGYWAIPAVMMIYYAMVGIELIAEQIEDPFGNDPDDLPIDQICEGIKNTVGEILA
jgi:putative membrane protein